jgi:hypothetical protein
MIEPNSTISIASFGAMTPPIQFPTSFPVCKNHAAGKEFENGKVPAWF